MSSFFSFLFLLALIPAANAGPRSLDEHLQEFTAAGMKMLPTESSPELYAWLREVTSNLNQALNDLEHDSGKTHRLVDVHIAQNAQRLENNAWHLDLKPEREGDAPYAVFISTGLIQRLASTSPPEPMERVLERMTGILAHEIAHSSKALLEEEKTSRGSQFKEARVDTIALELLRRGGYPRTDILRGLEALDEFSSSKTAVFSTHPGGAFRTSLARQFATLDAFTRGEYKLRSHKTTSKLTAEIKAMTPIVPTQALVSWEEAQKWTQSSLDLLKDGKTMKSAPETKCALSEAVHGLRWLAASLGEDPAQQKIFLDILKEFQTHILERQELYYDYKCPSNKSPPAQVVFQNALEKNPFFLSREYLMSLSEGAHEYRLPDFVPQNAKVHWFILQHVSPLSQSPGSEQVTLKKQILFNQVSPDFYFETPEPYTDLLKEFTPILGKLHQISPFLEELQKKEGEKLKSNRHYILNQFLTFHFATSDFIQKHPDLKTQLRELAQYLWDHRAEFARIELIALLFNKKTAYTDGWINWKAVFETLNIPEEQGKKDLRLAVIGSIRESLHPSHLASNQEKEDDLTHFFKTGHAFAEHDSPFKQLYWDGPELANYLTDQFTTSTRKAPTEYWNRPYLKLIHLDSVHEKVLSQFKKEISSISPEEHPEKVVEVWIDTLKTLEKGGQNERGSFLNDPNHKNPIHQKFMNWLKEAPLSQNAKGKILKKLVDDCSQSSTYHSSEQFPDFLPFIDQYEVFPTLKERYSFFNHFGTTETQTRLSEGTNGQPFWKSHTSSLLTTFNLEFLENFLIKIDPYVEKLVRDLASLTPPLSSDELMKRLTPYLIPEIPGVPNTSLQELPQLVNEARSDRSLAQTKAAVVRELLKTDQSFAEITRHFEILTMTGATEDTDDYILNKVKKTLEIASPELRSRVIEAIRKWVQPQLSHHSSLPSAPIIWGENTRGKLYSIVLEQDLKSHPNVQTVLKSMEEIFPKKSPTRDQLLEQIAWNLPIDSLIDIQNLIQPLKSRNLSSGFDPLTINLASGIIQQILQRSLEERIQFIQYLLNPKSYSTYPRQMITQFTKDLPIQDREKLSLENDSVDYLKHLALDTSALEKTSVLEVLLGGKSTQLPQSLIKSKQDLDLLLKEFVGIESGSTKAKIMEAYLNSIPDYERPIALSYLLAHSNGNDSKTSDVKPLFEIFSTVGVKSGQLASILNSFQDDKISQDLSSLKDQASPMEKGEILETLRKTLRPDQFSRIKRVSRILGSASVKTVVELELQPLELEGTAPKVVVMLRRPYAENRVAENLTRVKRFLTEISRDPELAQKAAPISASLKIVEAELEEELNLNTELARTAQAGKIYGTSQEPSFIQIENSKWKVQVPQISPHFPEVLQLDEKTDPSKPQLLFMEMAENAKTLDKVQNPQMKAQAGQALLQLSLKNLFQSGFMNADPHKGNFLIDEEHQTIYPIDFGQAETLTCSESIWSQDDRTRLVAFLNAVQFQSPVLTARWGMVLAGFPADSPQEVLLRQELESLGPQWSFQTVLQALAKLNATPQKRFFGILKGLLVLQAEKFVPEAEFNSTLKSEILKFGLTQKPGALVKTAAGDSWCSLRRSFHSKLNLIPSPTELLKKCTQPLTRTAPECQSR